MIRGFYTALSGLIATMTRQSVVADNIANINTTGFKQNRTSETDFELSLVESAGGALGPLGSATLATAQTVDRSQGALEMTGVPTDLAISGDGLFVVAHGGGIAYTRAGDFAVDVNRTLVTQAGDPVLDTTGRTITAPATFTVAADGTVVGTGQRIDVRAFPAGELTRLGGNLFAASGTPGPGSGTVVQGSIEHSNVDLSTAMSELMSFQRSYSLDSRALSIQDGTLGDATQLGRLR